MSEPFNPNDQFDAAAEAMRKRIVDAIIAEREGARFRGLGDTLEVSAILAGGLTAVIGTLLCSTQPECHDEVMMAATAYLTHARANVDAMMETGP